MPSFVAQTDQGQHQFLAGKSVPFVPPIQNARKERCHGRLIKTIGDEDKARTAVAAWPCRETERRVKDVLDALHHDRFGPTADIYQSFHPQQAFSMGLQQQCYRLSEGLPPNRFAKTKAKADDAMIVLPSPLMLVSARSASLVMANVNGTRQPASRVLVFIRTGREKIAWINISFAGADDRPDGFRPGIIGLHDLRCAAHAKKSFLS